MRPRVAILHAPGTNRDQAAKSACAMAGAEPSVVPWALVERAEIDLRTYQMLVIPGGFSFGDDLGAGRVWAALLQHRAGDALRRFVDEGKPVLGICNGFQVLVKAGILPRLEPAQTQTQTVTLAPNGSERFECRWVTLRCDPLSPCVFTQGIDALLTCPVAHAEGRFVANAVLVDELERRHLVALRYVDPSGASASYPHNPNGSLHGIAGICNPAGNVLGLMPHPEDHIRPEQHPLFHHGHAGGLGLQIFERGIAATGARAPFSTSWAPPGPRRAG